MSRNQTIQTYRNFRLSMDYNNHIHIYKNQNHVAEVDSMEDAYDYIDNMKSNERNVDFTPTINKKEYLIYIKGTRSASRAMYLSKKSKMCSWQYARDADRYSEKETKAIIRNSTQLDSHSC